MYSRASFCKGFFILTLVLAIGLMASACRHSSSPVYYEQPTISSFSASPSTITLGQGTLLAWTATGKGATVSIDQGVGEVQGSSVAVSPTATTTYTLTATSPGGSATATVTMTVQTFVPKLVYVANSGSHSVSGFTLDDATGALTPLAGSPFAASGSHSDVVVHPSGRYLFTAGKNTDVLHVFAIDEATGALTEADGSPYALAAGTYPTGVAVNPTGEYVFVKGELAPSRIHGYRIDIDTGALTEAAGSPYTELPGSSAWHGLTFSPTLDVLYATILGTDVDVAAFGSTWSRAASPPSTAAPMPGSETTAATRSPSAATENGLSRPTTAAIRWAWRA